MAGGLIRARAGVAFQYHLEGSPVLAALGRKAPFPAIIQPRWRVDPVTNASTLNIPSVFQQGVFVKGVRVPVPIYYVDLSDGRARLTYEELNTLNGDEEAQLFGATPATVVVVGGVPIRTPSKHYYAQIVCIAGETIGTDGKLDPLPGARMGQYYIEGDVG